jgi:hypothetical protein
LTYRSTFTGTPGITGMPLIGSNRSALVSRLTLMPLGVPGSPGAHAALLFAPANRQ